MGDSMRRITAMILLKMAALAADFFLLVITLATFVMASIGAVKIRGWEIE